MLIKNEKRILNQIKKKVINNNAIISISDKGNSMAIIHQDTHHEKVMDFIHKNKFTNTTEDVTKKKFQKELRKNINECLHTIHKDEILKYVNLNPSPPIIGGMIKIHKTDSPIRPTVSWKDAPAYKLAKTLARNLEISFHSHIHLILRIPFS
jgi:hypothetical protein